MSDREIFVQNERGIIYRDQVDPEFIAEVDAIYKATEEEIALRREAYARGLRDLYETTASSIEVAIECFLTRTGIVPEKPEGGPDD